jgi:hypothetical protein
MSRPACNRAFAAAVVCAFWAGARIVWPDEMIREERVYLCITTLGYGHFIAAAIGSQRPTSATALASTRWLARSFVASGIASGLYFYTWLLQIGPIATLPFALALIWHVVENDRCLTSAYRRPGALGPLARSRGDTAWLAAVAVATLIALTFTQEISHEAGWSPSAWQPRLIDIYGIPVLYHLTCWLKLAVDRARAGSSHDRIRRYARLCAAHAPPLAIGLLVAAERPEVELFRRFLFSPGIYLYWSALHVLQTAIARERSARERENRIEIALNRPPQRPIPESTT